jgi:hypothetical protein
MEENEKKHVPDVEAPSGDLEVLSLFVFTRNFRYPVLTDPPYQTYRGFLKCGYTLIIHFNRIFHYKSSILGYHH